MHKYHRALFVVLLCSLLMADNLIAQDQNVSTGLPMLQNQKGAIFDLSDPNAVNIKVSVWGAVKNPGYYIVPDYTNVNTLLSFAGGPTEISKLSDIKIFRVDKDSLNPKIIKFDYDGIFWNGTTENYKVPPSLLPGDIMFIPFESKIFLKDILSLGISATAAIFALLTVILQISK